MHLAIATLGSLSPLMMSQRVPERESKESWDAYEKRICRERLHVNKAGNVFIPPMFFKRSLETAASYLRMRIPGKDRSEFGKHFRSGVLVVDGLVLPLKPEDVAIDWRPRSSRGKKGQADVMKGLPMIEEWSGDVTYHILDEIITEDVFEKHLEEAGSFIGIGTFRPENGGFCGRYEVVRLDWK
jgi:hypothetical protein